MRRSKLWLGLIMLSAMLIMVLTTLTDAPTYDEPAHIVAGLTYTKLADLRLNSEHPPLLKFLSGLSLQLFYPALNFAISESELQDPHTNVVYELGSLLFANNDPTKLLLIARMPSLTLTLLTIFFVYQLTVDISKSEKKGLIAAILFAFEFNVLANGPLVTTDLPLLAFWLGMLLFYLRYLFKKGGHNLILAGIFFGLALLTKYSAVFILPIIFFASLIFIKQVKLSRILLSLMAMVVVAWGVVWLFYLPFGSPNFIWEELPAVQAVMTQVKSEKINELINFLPLPYYYRYGLKLINHHEFVGQLQFLAGKVSQFNWWWFYPVTFLVKSAELYLILFFIAVYLLAKNKFNNQKLNFILITITLYCLLVINSSLAFGMRILLPITAFGVILIATTFDWIKNTQIIKMLLVFYILLGVMRFPYFFASANVFSSLWGNKYAILVDANLDWGQDLKRLSSWSKNENVENISVLAHTPLPIAIYGIDNLDLNQTFKQRGLLAVSATKLNLPMLIENEAGVEQTVRLYDLLANYKIKAKVGSFLIYDLAQVEQVEGR